VKVSRIVRGLKHARRIAEVPAVIGTTSEWPALTAAYSGLSVLTYPHRVPFRRGSAVTLENFQDLATFWQIFFAGAYHVKPSDRRIVDAGANHGMFTLYTALRSPQATIASLEPFPATFERLRRTVAENGIAERVMLFPAALHGRDGIAHMDSGADIGSQFRRVQATGGTAVESISLESLLAKCNWDSVDLLKLDIEGSEFEVLLNAPAEALRRIRRISMEFHPRPDENRYVPELLFEHLRSAGFHLTQRRDDGDGYGIARLESLT